MGKTANKKLTKEQKEQKNFESKELSKYYYDLTPLKLKCGDIGLKQLKFGTILSHDLEAVVIGLDTIELKSSWTEFILIMLSQLIETKDNFKELLGKYAITNQNLYVEKIYGNYSFSSQQYTVYKIFDTDYYLEAKLSERIIFHTMVKLLRLLEIDPKSIRFRVVIKDFENETVEEKLKYKTEQSSIEDTVEKIENKEHIAYIKVGERTEEVHRIDVALLLFCNIIYDTYGMLKMMSLKNAKYTGICMSESATDYPCARIRDSMLFAYTNGDTDDIVEFIKNASETLGIKVEFGFRAR